MPGICALPWLSEAYDGRSARTLCRSNRTQPQQDLRNTSERRKKGRLSNWTRKQSHDGNAIFVWRVEQRNRRLHAESPCRRQLHGERPPRASSDHRPRANGSPANRSCECSSSVIVSAVLGRFRLGTASVSITAGCAPWAAAPSSTTRFSRTNGQRRDHE